ncbi:MAG: RDD family protein, partial [Spirochaetaceae bacterium]|nr:RDD family protein [Spirochaetaceae bacterium]
MERKGFRPRVAASLVDASLAAALAIILSRATGYFFAIKAAATLGIGEPDSSWKGPLPMLIGMFGIFFYGLPFSFLLVSLPEFFSGRGPGKLVFRLRVGGADGGSAGRGALLLRGAAKTLPWWGTCLAFCLESWPCAAASALASVVLLLGFFLVLGRER